MCGDGSPISRRTLLHCNVASLMTTRVIHADSPRRIAAAAREGAEAIRAGKLVGFATETVYGVGALATDASAMKRLRELKSRPERPFTVHLGDPSDAERYVRDLPDVARRLTAKAWPGPLTLLVPVGGKLADAKLRKAGLYKKLCHRDVIGLRCPDAPVARKMLSAVTMPVVAPSANLAGEPSPRAAADVLASLEGRIDLLIDSGPARHGKDSTVVLVDGEEWKIVRKGVYDERSVWRLLKRNYLFVCTGNTCRSPMAAGIAKRAIAEHLGCKVSQLRGRGVEVGSAGILAGEGARATDEAIAAARQRGADISRHRSRKLTTELIGAADLILCMTDFHVEQVRRTAPSPDARAQRLDTSGGVSDPMGGGSGVYRRTARQIENALAKLLKKGLL